MSNSLAIAAVTATLGRLIDRGLDDLLPGTDVTTKPLDKARNGSGQNQVNLFLYQTTVNPAWRNMDMPQQTKPGETGHPPLALDLFYLLTAYGKNDEDTDGHQALGLAMKILHDHPVLGRDEVKQALTGSDLHEQIERIRITPQPMPLEDLSKLWTTFQSEYRISTAYQVSVVLIESTRPARTPLPVLTRGPGDEGIAAQADLTPPFPTLETVRPPRDQPSARLGDVLTLSGHHLEGDNVIVRLTNPHLSDQIDVSTLAGGTAVEIKVELPNEPTNWPAGFYTVAAVVSQTGEPDRTTNELSFSLAPRILNTSFSSPSPELAEKCDMMLTITTSPHVWPEQRVAALLGYHEIPAQPHPAQTNTLDFCLKDVTVGDYFLRLRIDGVDSLLVDRSVTPPVFDESQKVTVP